MNLATLQRRFAAALLGTGDGADALRIGGPAPAGRLLQLYRNNFRLGLGDLLEALYPVTRALVGADCFTGLARRYCLRRPLRQPALTDFDDGFADSLHGVPGCDGLPYLAEVARLEWAVNRADQASPPAPFPFEALAALPPRAQTRVRLRLAPGVTLLACDHAARAIWDGVRNDALAGIETDRGERLLVHPEGADGAQVEALAPHAFALLEAIAAGRPLAELPLTPAAPPLTALIAAGLIDHFTPPETDHDRHPR